MSLSRTVSPTRTHFTQFYFEQNNCLLPGAAPTIYTHTTSNYINNGSELRYREVMGSGSRVASNGCSIDLQQEGGLGHAQWSGPDIGKTRERSVRSIYVDLVRGRKRIEGARLQISTFRASWKHRYCPWGLIVKFADFVWRTRFATRHRLSVLQWCPSCGLNWNRKGRWRSRIVHNKRKYIENLRNKKNREISHIANLFCIE